MNPDDDGYDDLDDPELELRGLPRWIAYPVIGLCGGIGWVVIAFAVKACIGSE